MVKENDYNFSYTILFLFCLRKFEAPKLRVGFLTSTYTRRYEQLQSDRWPRYSRKSGNWGGEGENKAWYNLSQKRRTGLEIVPPVTAIYGSCNQFD